MYHTLPSVHCLPQVWACIKSTSRSLYVCTQTFAPAMILCKQVTHGLHHPRFKLPFDEAPYSILALDVTLLVTLTPCADLCLCGVDSACTDGRTRGPRCRRRHCCHEQVPLQGRMPLQIISEHPTMLQSRCLISLFIFASRAGCHSRAGSHSR